MATASTLLRIHEGRAIEAVAAYLHELIERHSSEGVIVGLSGGLDSSVLASLVVGALGSDLLRAVYLRDADSERGAGSHADAVARSIGVDLIIEDMDSSPWSCDDTPPASVRFTRRSPALNRLMFRAFRLSTGETPFVASLRAGAGGEKASARTGVGRFADEIFYARHLYRRKVLEERATAENRLLLGGANRTEWEVGWFVKGGIDDLPYQPLLGLYKTQVRQLGRHLGLPREALERPPSADMMPGISDEFAMGMSYDTLDVALDHLAGGTSREAARGAGVSDGHLRLVSEMHELSRWKRTDIAQPLPPDGGSGGGLRVWREH